MSCMVNLSLYTCHSIQSGRGLGRVHQCTKCCRFLLVLFLYFTLFPTPGFSIILKSYCFLHILYFLNGFKTESARTSSITWTKLCTKIIYILLQTSALLFQIHYQEKSFLTTPNLTSKPIYAVPLNFSESLKRLFYNV